MNKNINELNKIFKKYCIKLEGINHNTNIDSIKIDELSKVQICMEIERKFDVEFDIDKISELETVKDIIMFLDLK